jgi:hypothetical protein
MKIDYEFVKSNLSQFLIFNSKKEDMKKILIDQGLNGYLNSSSIEFKTQQYKNSLLIKTIEDFYRNDLFQTDAVLLKGPALLLLGVYESYGERSIGDIDLLVNDLAPFKNFFLVNGYELVENYKWSANNYKLLFSKLVHGVEIVIELHTRLYYHIDLLTYETIVIQNKIRILANEEFLVHLIGHLAYMHSFLKLHWLLDIYLFIKLNHERIDYEKFYFLISKYKFENSLRLINCALYLVFGEIIFKKINSNFLIRKVMTPNFLIRPETNKLQYYLIKHLVKENIISAIKYDLLWVTSRGWTKSEH